jgi:glycosyltransferase involved in cell wall biosynthesis
MAVAEAMAHGLPVVASRVGALPEIVRDRETGVLVEPNDSTALAEALAQLLLDPEARQTLGSRGREVVSALPDPDDVAVQTLNFYRSLVAPSSDAV